MNKEQSKSKVRRKIRKEYRSKEHKRKDWERNKCRKKKRKKSGRFQLASSSGTFFTVPHGIQHQTHFKDGQIPRSFSTKTTALYKLKMPVMFRAPALAVASPMPQQGHYVQLHWTRPGKSDCPLIHVHFQIKPCSAHACFLQPSFWGDLPLAYFSQHFRKPKQLSLPLYSICSLQLLFSNSSAQFRQGFSLQSSQPVPFSS